MIIGMSKVKKLGICRRVELKHVSSTGEYGEATPFTIFFFNLSGVCDFNKYRMT